MKNRKTIDKLMVAVAIATGMIGLAIAQERTSDSNRAGQNLPSTPPDKCPSGECEHLGMVGITRGQTARLHAYDKSTVDNPLDVKAPNSVASVPPGPCREVELMFFDSMGNVRQRSAQCLMPGHAVFLDLNGNSLEMTGLRAEIRGLVRFVEDPNQSGPNNIKLGASLEVFDNETGRTSFVLMPAVENTWAGR